MPVILSDLRLIARISILSSGTKISLLFDGFFFRYFSLQKSLSRIKYGTGCSVGYVRFYKKKYRKNNHVKILSLFLSHYLRKDFHNEEKGKKNKSKPEFIFFHLV